jgi:hypothetical protein
VVAEALGDHLVTRLTEAGRPIDPASSWACGAVGMVAALADGGLAALLRSRDGSA